MLSKRLATTEAPGNATVDLANRLLDALASSQGPDRAEAERALPALGEEETRTLHKVLLQRVRKWNQLKIRSEGRTLWYGCGSCAGFLALLFLLPFLRLEVVQIVGVSAMGSLLSAGIVEGLLSSDRVRIAQTSFRGALDILVQTPDAALAPLLLQPDRSGPQTEA